MGGKQGRQASRSRPDPEGRGRRHHPHLFPEARESEHASLVEISWDGFFKQFEESELALLHGEESMFSKIFGRDTVERRKQGDHDAARD